MHKIFVYGTLRPLADNQEEWIASGLSLFNLGRFPAVVPSNYGVTVGQVMEVDDGYLAQLDKYEVVEGGLYTREKITIHREGEGTQEVWAYLGGEHIKEHIRMARRAGHELLIKSGDWNEAA